MTRQARHSHAGRWRDLAPWFLVALVALLPYLNALQDGFAFDDGGLILENPSVARTAPWWRSLTASFWPESHHAGLYRPITALSLRLQRGAHGDDPAAFHGLNLLLHAAVCLLVYALLRRLTGRHRGLALAVSVLFAVHPLHTEAVTYVVGRAELLAALAGLGAYWLWLFGRGAASPIGAGLLFALAVGSKESAVAWVLVLAAHRLGLLGDGRAYRDASAQGGAALRQALIRDAAVLAGFAVYLVARDLALGSLLGLGTVSRVDNPLFDAPFATRLLTGVSVVARGWGLMLLPRRLSADYSYDAIRLQTSWLSPAGALTLVLIVGLVAAWRWRRRAPLVAWSTAMYVALLLPVSNLLVPIGTILAERLLYLPSLGALCLIGCALRALLQRARLLRLAPWLVAAVALLLAARTWDRNRDWRDDRALFRAAVAAQPRSVKAHANLGSVLAKSGAPADLQEAERQYRAALAVEPTYLSALSGLGYVLTIQREYAEAEEVLERAVKLHPENPDAWTRLGNLQLETGRATDALASFGNALRDAPTLADAWIGKASALFMLERFDASADAWIEAQRLAADRIDLHRHVVAACARAGRWREAEAVLRERLARRPSDVGLLRELVRTLLAGGDCSGARAVLTSDAASVLDAAQRRALADSVSVACP